ncbi:MAG: hypothetical protein ACHQEM_06085 [Chitinophagales bacterium]
MNWNIPFRRKPFFIRLLHWEYWSFNILYSPIYMVWVWFSFRARSFFFFAAANPSIKNGGFLAESKKDISALIPSALQPKTAFFSIPSNPDIVLNELYERGLRFPLIGKPDMGAKGRGIMALRDQKDLIAYVRSSFTNFHIQEFVAYKLEVGVFYYRFPDKETGNVSGIVRKEFLKVKGDGRSNIRELLGENERGVLQIGKLEKSGEVNLNQVLDAGVERIVVPYGNHARGAKFIDDSHLIDQSMTETIDNICKKIPGFYFGRLDIRYQDWESLKQGKNFSIIEVNGAGSEPTHIYDPRHSMLYAWKEIIRHLNILYKISVQNHRRGHPYLTVREGMKMFKEDRLNSKKLAAMDIKV